MQNKVIEEKFAAIIDSACYWLGYQLKIGREQLIHEASLRYPLADSITANGTAIQRIVLEQLHPLFKSKKIDLVIYDKTVKQPEAEKDDQNLNEVFELKLAKSETGKVHGDEHQRVFDDVVRLAYYNKWGKKQCYFMMCGTYENFKSYFVGEQNVITTRGKKNFVSQKTIKTPLIPGQVIEEWTPDGPYKDWFSFVLGEPQTIIFDDKDPDWGLSQFQKKYKVRDEKMHVFSSSINIQTTCMAISSVGDKNKTHAAGIWRIESK